MKSIINAIKLFYYNHFKHVKIITGVDCEIKSLKLSVCGKNNTIHLGDCVKLENVKIKIYGNDNKIVIGNNNTIFGISFAIEDNKNSINVGGNVYIGTGSLLAALEGTKIIIGQDCMIAGPAEIRTSDSHSLVNLNGDRLNYAQDICIGKHVWIGTGCILLKGSNIPSDCVIAARSVISSTSGWKPYSLYGGVPARLIKYDINWNKNRF